MCGGFQGGGPKRPLLHPRAAPKKPILNRVNDLNNEEIIRSFYEKELQKTNQKELRIEKKLKKKGDKLYVKWKRYDNSFNNWINKKDIL